MGQFYESLRFARLEVFPMLWDTANPWHGCVHTIIKSRLKKGGIFIYELQRRLLKSVAESLAAFIGVIPVAQGTAETGAKENQEIQEGSQNCRTLRPGTENKAKQEHSGVEQSQPFNLNRDKEKQQKLKIRVHDGESKKQGHVQIIVCCRPGTKPCDNGAEHPKKIVDIKPEAPPLPFQRGPDKIIEIQGKYHE